MTEYVTAEMMRLKYAAHGDPSAESAYRQYVVGRRLGLHDDTSKSPAIADMLYRSGLQVKESVPTPGFAVRGDSILVGWQRRWPESIESDCYTLGVVPYYGDYSLGEVLGSAKHRNVFFVAAIPVVAINEANVLASVAANAANTGHYWEVSNLILRAEQVVWAKMSSRMKCIMQERYEALA